MIKSFMIVIACLLLVGCDENDKPKVVVEPSGVKQEVVQATRFKVKSEGVFSGGYKNHEREIFIITDTQTGREYLSITGVGTTEINYEKSGKTTNTVEE